MSRPTLRRPGLPAVNRRLPDLSLKVRAGIAIGVVVVVLAAVAGIVFTGGPGYRTISADFAEAPGLYKDNHVDVLGVPVGTIESVSPHPSYVVVRMSVRSDVKLPQGAFALLEAPDVVNDRYVQIGPVYTGGPTLSSGATIPLARTRVPISTDEILANLDTLVKDLGPTAANKQGAVSAVLAQLAKVLQGNGPNLNASIVQSGRALGALAADGPAIRSLLDSLGTFSQSAAADSAAYTAFITDLASVTSELAGDNQDLGGALHNLQTALGQITTFVAANRQALGGTLANTSAFFAVLAKEQAQLAAVLKVTPLALQNITNAIDLNAPGGPALRSRYDPTTGSATVTKQVCGNTLLRLLVVATEPSKATPLDVTCGFSSLIENLGTPPNSPTGPATSLSTLTGSGS